MDQIVALQRWLYGSMASGLGDVAGGQPRAVFVAMAAAILFGAVHALMPGHGKMVLVSYHLGQKTTLAQSIANGSILALTHVGLALVLVLAGFAVISRAFAYGGRTPQFETASGILVALIGTFLLWRALKGSHDTQTEDGGKTLAVVTGLIPCPLTSFIMSYALARGLLAAGLAVTAAMTLGMIVTIAGVTLTATLARGRFMSLLARTEGWRHRAGQVLEIAGAAMVLTLGLWLIVSAAT
ncbi:MAG: nickel/cobalt transporter [Methyloceanibacter sp.]|uniref:nickel/cobalt transporter n=1 Tax=Methyloceanibacter sp. TaxID=1965321 RepID=UPI003D9B14EF